MTFEIFSYWFTLVGLVWLACGIINFILGMILDGVDSDELLMTPILLIFCMGLGPLGLVGAAIDYVDWEKFRKKKSNL